MADEDIVIRLKTEGGDHAKRSLQDVAKASGAAETATERLGKAARDGLKLDGVASKAAAAFRGVEVASGKATAQVTTGAAAAAKAMATLDAATDSSTGRIKVLGSALASIDFEKLRNGGAVLGAAGAAGLMLSESFIKGGLEADRLGGKMSSLLTGKGLESGINSVKELANALAGLTGGDDDQIAAGLAGAISSGRLQSLKEYGVVISANGQAAIEAAGKISAQAKSAEILNQVLIAGKTAVENLKAGTSDAAIALGEMDVRMGNLSETFGMGGAKAKAALLGGILSPIMAIVEKNQQLGETAGGMLYIGSAAATGAGGLLSLASQAAMTYQGLLALAGSRAANATAATANATASTAEAAAITASGNAATVAAGKMSLLGKMRALTGGASAFGLAGAAALGVGGAAVLAGGYAASEVQPGIRNAQSLSDEELRNKGAMGKFQQSVGGWLGNSKFGQMMEGGGIAHNAAGDRAARQAAEMSRSFKRVPVAAKAVQALSTSAAASPGAYFTPPNVDNTRGGFDSPATKAARKMATPALDPKAARVAMGAIFAGMSPAVERMAAIQRGGGNILGGFNPSSSNNDSIYSDGSTGDSQRGAPIRQHVTGRVRSSKVTNQADGGQLLHLTLEIPPIQIPAHPDTRAAQTMARDNRSWIGGL